MIDELFGCFLHQAVRQQIFQKEKNQDLIQQIHDQEMTDCDAQPFQQTTETLLGHICNANAAAILQVALQVQ